MATQAQILANRSNAQNATGPKSKAGKDRTRFNGLKHGLRAEQVVLPHEDPAAFEAERQAWFDDWKPTTHTRAILVERAAVAAWRLRRSARAEAARLHDLADDAARDFDRVVADEIHLLLDDLDRHRHRDRHRRDDLVEPMDIVGRLRETAEGVDVLARRWEQLGAALAEGPSAWDRERHERMLGLLGWRVDDDPAAMCDRTRDSARLAASNRKRGRKPAPLDPAEAEGIVAGLRAGVAEHLAELAEARAALPAEPPERRRAVEAACLDASKEGQLLHRYEMAHERSLRGSIKQLSDLAKSGADEAEWAEETPQGEGQRTDKSEEAVAPTGPNPPAPAAPTGANPESAALANPPTEPNFGPPPASATGSDGLLEGSIRPVGAAGEGGMQRSN